MRILLALKCFSFPWKKTVLFGWNGCYGGVGEVSALCVFFGENRASGVKHLAGRNATKGKLK